MHRLKVIWHTRRTGVVLAALAALTAVVVLSLWFASTGAQAQLSPQLAHQSNGPGGGIPITRPGQTPAFTEADARTWVEQNGFPGGNTTTGKPFTIDSVDFITREQAEARTHGESLEGQVAPGDIVCYVVLTGPFDGSGIDLPIGVTPKPSDLAGYHGVMIFDAHTGLLLMWGYD
jgi:hypothetical protein